MKYYKLVYDYEKSDSWIFLHFDQNKLPFNRYDITKALKIPNTKLFCKITQGKPGDCDYLANNLAFLIVSDKVKRIMEEFALCKCDFIEVVEEDTNQHLGYLINCLEHFAALDEENAVCERFPNSKIRTLLILRYAVQEDKLGGKDFFKLQEDPFPHFVSQRLMKKFVSEKVIGFDFESVISE